MARLAGAAPAHGRGAHVELFSSVWRRTDKKNAAGQHIYRKLLLVMLEPEREDDAAGEDRAVPWRWDEEEVVVGWDEVPDEAATAAPAKPTGGMAPTTDAFAALFDTVLSGAGAPAQSGNAASAAGAAALRRGAKRKSDAPLDAPAPPPPPPPPPLPTGTGGTAPAATKRVARVERRARRKCLVSLNELGDCETLGAFAMLEGAASTTPRPRFSYLGQDVFSLVHLTRWHQTARARTSDPFPRQLFGDASGEWFFRGEEAPPSAVSAATHVATLERAAFAASMNTGDLLCVEPTPHGGTVIAMSTAGFVYRWVAENGYAPLVPCIIPQVFPGMTAHHYARAHSTFVLGYAHGRLCIVTLDGIERPALSRVSNIHVFAGAVGAVAHVAALSRAHFVAVVDRTFYALERRVGAGGVPTRMLQSSLVLPHDVSLLCALRDEPADGGRRVLVVFTNGTIGVVALTFCDEAATSAPGPAGDASASASAPSLELLPARTERDTQRLPDTQGACCALELADGRVLLGRASGACVLVARPDARGRTRLTHVLHGHEHDVTALAQLSDGRLASGGNDRSVRVWPLPAAPVDARTGQPLAHDQYPANRAWPEQCLESSVACRVTGFVHALRALPHEQFIVYSLLAPSPLVFTVSDEAEN